MEAESYKSWNSILQNLIRRLHWRLRTNMYDNIFTNYRKTVIATYI